MYVSNGTYHQGSAGLHGNYNSATHISCYGDIPGQNGCNTSSTSSPGTHAFGATSVGGSDEQRSRLQSWLRTTQKRREENNSQVLLKWIDKLQSNGGKLPAGVVLPSAAELEVAARTTNDDPSIQSSWSTPFVLPGMGPYVPSLPDYASIGQFAPPTAQPLSSSSHSVAHMQQQQMPMFGDMWMPSASFYANPTFIVPPHMTPQPSHNNMFHRVAPQSATTPQQASASRLQPSTNFYYFPTGQHMNSPSPISPSTTVFVPQTSPVGSYDPLHRISNPPWWNGASVGMNNLPFSSTCSTASASSRQQYYVSTNPQSSLSSTASQLHSSTTGLLQLDGSSSNSVATNSSSESAILGSSSAVGSATVGGSSVAGGPHHLLFATQHHTLSE